MAFSDGAAASRRVVEILDELEIRYLVVGSFSSTAYSVPRSTKDADFAIAVTSEQRSALLSRLDGEFNVDPQASFESVTGTLRHILHIPEVAFKIELFLISDDPHDQQRLSRRVEKFAPALGVSAFLPTAEDVIITKLRWAVRAARNKDSDDVRDIIAVQSGKLDWPYIHHWAAEHGTRQTLDEIVASIPPDLLEETP